MLCVVGRGVEETLNTLRSFLLTLNGFCPRLRAVKDRSLVPPPMEHKPTTQPTCVGPSRLCSVLTRRENKAQQMRTQSCLPALTL